MVVAAGDNRGGGSGPSELQAEYERMAQVERRDARRAAALEAGVKTGPAQLGGGMDAKVGE